ncbi:MAG: hypothetical protein H7Y01_09375, partial [Ferruginibacter sp.]|nr:hypothetical protein [Chitinophagaceae bacterium]
MKNSSVTTLLVALFAASFLLSSCEQDHDIVKKPFKVRTSTWYRVSPTALTPVVVNGVTYAGFAHFPGGGSGNATHMGNSKTYYNQLT